MKRSVIVRVQLVYISTITNQQSQDTGATVSTSHVKWCTIVFSQRIYVRSSSKKQDCDVVKSVLCSIMQRSFEMYILSIRLGTSTKQSFRNLQVSRSRGTM